MVADELATAGMHSHTLVGLDTTSGRREMTEGVDPPGAAADALLQRAGLTLDDGLVVFSFGGNYGDCASYRGRVVAVPESGGTPSFFTVDARPGESQGAVWMGGAAPVVDSAGHLWVSTGNGSVHTSAHAFDGSDAVLELSPSLHLVQFFAPSTWASDNAQDLDMSTAPVLLSDGQIIVAGKAHIVYLLNSAHLGGIGGQQAQLPSACADDIDGGSAVVGMTVYLPCLSGIVAVRATSSPPTLRLLWSSGAGGGPPVVAAGLVWTIGQNGTLYALDAATGDVRMQAPIGAEANHFPTPSVGGGLMVAACADAVVAFRAFGPGSAPAGRPAAADSRQAKCHFTAVGPPISQRKIAAAAVACLVLIVAVATLGWLILRRRSSGGPSGAA